MCDLAIPISLRWILPRAPFLIALAGGSFGHPKPSAVVILKAGGASSGELTGRRFSLILSWV
jgi:hypothetical protein